MTINIYKKDLMTKDAWARYKYGARPLHHKQPCNPNHTYDYYQHKDEQFKYMRVSIVQDENEPVHRKYIFEECDNIADEEIEWKEIDKKGQRYLYDMHSAWRKINDDKFFKAYTIMYYKKYNEEGYAPIV